MLDKLKYTVKHSAIYGLGNLSSKVLGFALLPIYFHYLTIEQYGILALFEITAQIFSEVLLISIPTSLIRWHAAEENINKKKSIVFTSFAFIILVSSLVSLIFIPFSNNLSLFFFNTNTYNNEFTYLFLWVSFSLIDRIVLSLIRVKQKSLFFAILSFVKLLIILTSNIIFIVYLGYGIDGILLSLVIGHLCAVLISIPFVIKNSNLKFNFPILVEMLQYGFPLIFSTISSLALSLGDRYIIKIFLGNAAVGVYNAGFKIASLINVFINQPFQLGFLPIAFSQINQENSGRFYSKVLTYLTLILLLAFVLVGLFGEHIIRLVTSKAEYLESIKIIPLLALSFVFKGIQYILGLGFHYVKKTKYNAYLVMVAASINVGLNILFIPIFGISAAVVNMNISMIILIVITYYFVQKKYFISYELKKISLSIFTAIIIVGLSFLLLNSVTNFMIIISIKTLGLLLFPFVLFSFNFLEEIEKERILQSWKKWKNPKNWKHNIKSVKF